MHRNHIVWTLGLAGLVLVGCAALRQAGSDYSVGQTTPMAVGEATPAEVATSVVAPLVPYIPAPLQPVAGIIVLAATAIFTWRRGRRIRLGKAPESAASTSWLAGSITAVKDAFAGLYEVGPDGSPIKRSWKTLVSVALGLVGASVTIPAVKDVILANPDVVGLITLVASALSGVEKELSNHA